MSAPSLEDCKQLDVAIEGEGYIVIRLGNGMEIGRLPREKALEMAQMILNWQTKATQ